MAELSDDDTIKAMEKSFEKDGVIYAPIRNTEDRGNVWCVDIALATITEISESQAASLADENPTYIYFFASLTTSDVN